MIGSSGCRRHEGALAALAGHSEFSELTSAGRAALEHVDRCPACATTLGELMLTAMALRRMGVEATTLSGRRIDDAWSRLRTRLERTRAESRVQAWRGRATLNGLALSTLLVAVLVGPAALRLTTDAGSGPSGDATPPPRIVAIDRRLGTDGPNRPGPATPIGRSQVIRIDPDDNRPAQKEVSSTSLTVRPGPR